MIKIILFFVASILTTAGAQLCLKRGILKLGELNFSPSGLVNLCLKVLQNVWLLSGLSLFVISFVLWLFIISKIRLNIAYPIAVSTEVSLVVVSAWLFFHEYLSPLQVLGIVIVMAGIFLIATK